MLYIHNIKVRYSEVDIQGSASTRTIFPIATTLSSFEVLNLGHARFAAQMVSAAPPLCQVSLEFPGCRGRHNLHVGDGAGAPRNLRPCRRKPSTCLNEVMTRHI